MLVVQPLTGVCPCISVLSQLCLKMYALQNQQLHSSLQHMVHVCCNNLSSAVPQHAVLLKAGHNFAVGCNSVELAKISKWWYAAGVVANPLLCSDRLTDSIGNADAERGCPHYSCQTMDS